jgi:hypothetical protein
MQIRETFSNNNNFGVGGEGVGYCKRGGYPYLYTDLKSFKIKGLRLG